MDISLELAKKIHAARPQCTYFAKNKCKKGIKCPFKHHLSLDGTDEYQLPHVSVHTGDDNKMVLHLRPPLSEAFNMYFSLRGVEHRIIRQGKRLTDEITMFSLPFMLSPDKAATAETKLKGYAVTSSGRKPGIISSHELPKVVMHGTSMQGALSILCDGKINSSDGLAGKGIYTLEAQSFEEAHLLTTFERLGAGGYNSGAAFVMEPDGILVNIRNDEVVPAGAISFGKRKNEDAHQFSCNPGTLSYKFLIVNTAACVEALNSQLDRHGYSSQLHAGLMDAARELLREEACEDPKIRLLNQVLPHPVF